MNKMLRLAAAVAAPLLLAQCADSRLPGGSVGGNATVLKYDAQVTRTGLGIPHIKSNRADDFGSIGYGLGYSFAEDNLCVFLDDVVTIRGERAEFFGREGTYTIPANGSTANNIDSDFFIRFSLLAILIFLINHARTRNRHLKTFTAHRFNEYGQVQFTTS